MQFALILVHSSCGLRAALLAERFHDSQPEKETWGITFPWLPRLKQNSQSREISTYTMETTTAAVVPGDGQRITEKYGYIPMILKGVLLNHYSFWAGTSSSSDAETSRKVKPTVEPEVYLLRTEASALQKLPQWSSLVGKQRPPLQPKPLPFDWSLHVNTTYNYKKYYSISLW